MIAVLLGASFILVISVGVLLLVALPHIRRGSRILTPQGEQAVRRAKKKSSTAAAGAGRAATAVPAKIIEPLRGPKVKPARVPRSRRRLPPSRGGHGPVVLRPDDTGGLRLTRDVVGPVAIDPAVADSDVVVASLSWGGGAAPRHASGGVAYPAPKPGRRILPEPVELAEPAEGVEPGDVAEPVETAELVAPAVAAPAPEPEPARVPEPVAPEPEPVAPAAQVAPRPEPAPRPRPVAKAAPAPKLAPAPQPPQPAPAAPQPEAAAPGIGRPRPSPAESGPIPTDEAVSKPPIKPAAKGGSKPRSKSTRGAPRGRSGGRGARHPRTVAETHPPEVVDVRADEESEVATRSDASS